MPDILFYCCSVYGNLHHQIIYLFSMTFHIVNFLEKGSQKLVHIFCLLFFLRPNMCQLVYLASKLLHLLSLRIQSLLILVHAPLVLTDDLRKRWNVLFHKRI